MAPRGDRAPYWAEVIRQFVHSGRSRAEFCRRLGIRPKSLGNWLHRLAFRRQSEQLGDEPTAAVQPKPLFLPVVTTPTGPGPATLIGSDHDGSATMQLILGPTRRLAIPTGFDSERDAESVPKSSYKAGFTTGQGHRHHLPLTVEWGRGRTPGSDHFRS